MGVTVRVQEEDFDPQAEQDALTADRTDVGAVATFTGLCRSEGESLSALELEHYPGMAESQIEAAATRAADRFTVDALLVIHRYGKIAPGERIVFVAATSRHRDAAFDACRYVMDYLKTDAPFWKKEHRVDGSEGGWVDAKDADDAAKERWE
ncbi:MAG: molybdenum cofactor biosynthesis protein MoaE [Pseudomonadota bacterium]